VMTGGALRHGQNHRPHSVQQECGSRRRGLRLTGVEVRRPIWVHSSLCSLRYDAYAGSCMHDDNASALC